LPFPPLSVLSLARGTKGHCLGRQRRRFNSTVRYVLSYEKFRRCLRKNCNKGPRKSQRNPSPFFYGVPHLVDKRSVVLGNLGRLLFPFGCGTNWDLGFARTFSIQMGIPNPSRRTFRSSCRGGHRSADSDLRRRNHRVGRAQSKLHFGDAPGTGGLA